MRTSTPTRIAQPVFVVGAPRSGTSILTWALGQHPNILPTEESDWLGPFAVQAAAAHTRGSARGERSQLSALGITRSDFLRGFGDAIDSMILTHRFDLERRNHEIAQRDPQQVSPKFAVARAPGEPKSRWVDGTPEYSLHVRGLRALFPAAKFVHILRDADEVAASLLAFRDAGGQPLVADVEAAYSYWLRTTQACMQAATAYGGDVVHRVHYANLCADAESALRGILAFVNEAYVPACVEPFNRRINSSFADEFAPRERQHEVSPTIEQARKASALWSVAAQAATTDVTVVEQLETDFDARVRYVLELDANYHAAQRLLSELKIDLHERGIGAEGLAALIRDNHAALARTRRALNIAGILVAAQWFAALLLWLRDGDSPVTVWLALATVAMLVYAWLRRVGLCAAAARLFTPESKQERT
ncbi:MAG: sulfotransferase family protein [Rudaea sp.]